MSALTKNRGYRALSLLRNSEPREQDFSRASTILSILI